MKGKFTVFLATNEASLGAEIRREFEAAFQNLNLEIAYFDHWKRVLDELRLRKPDLIIVSTTITGASLFQITIDLRKNSGEAGIIFLGKSEIDLPPQALLFSLPIQNWTSFIESAGSFIPESVRVRAGLSFRSGPIYEGLLNYTKQISRETDRIDEILIHTIPIWHSSLETGPIPNANPTHHSELIEKRKASSYSTPVKLEKSKKLELSLLATSSAITVAAFVFDTDTSFMSARGITTILTATGIASFLIGKAVERGVQASLISKEQNSEGGRNA